MESFWNSLDIVSTISKTAQWTVAISAIVALVFSFREQTLKDRADNKTKAEQKASQDSLKQALLKTETERELADEILAQGISKTSLRKISPEQKERILANLKPRDKGKIEILFPSGDPESYLFAKSFKSIMQESGWEILKFESIELRKNYDVGIKILYYANKKSIDHKDDLYLILQNVKLLELRAVYEHKNAQQQDDSIALIVGYHSDTFTGVRFEKVK